MSNKSFSRSYMRKFSLRATGYVLCLALVLTMSIPLSAQTTAPSATEETSSTVARIRDRGNVLVAGVKQDFKPFGFVDDNGELVGFDIDVMRAMAEIWGVELELLPVTSANRIDKLMAGEVDIVAASMTHTRPRDSDIDFSQTYFLDGQSLLVGADSGIEDIQGLSGKTVGAVEGATSLEQIKQYAEQAQIPLTVAPFPGYDDALTAMRAGEADALTTDRAFLLQTALDNPEFTVVGERFTQEPYGIGVRSGDSYFRNLVGFALQQLQSNGTYEEIYAKWFPGETPFEPELLSGAWPYTFAESPDDFDPPASTRMVDIVQRRNLIAGLRYDFPPFGSIDENGKVVGFEVDLAREFARRWLGDPEAVEMVRVTSSSRIPALVNGEVDLLLASMSRQQQRSDAIDFGQTYFVDDQRLLVKQESDIDGVDDLDGRTVGAVTGSTALENIESLAESRGISVDILPFQEYVAAVRALEAGYVDALVDDRGALAYSAVENPDLAVVGEPLSEERYGIGVPHFDAPFRDLVNFTLQEMKLDGAYDAIYAKWFGDQPPYAIELWPGSSPRSSSIRLSNIAAGSAITPQPTPTATATAALPTPTETPKPTSSPTAQPSSEGTATAVPTAQPTPQVTATGSAAEQPAATQTPAEEVTAPLTETPPSAIVAVPQATPASGLYVTIPDDYGVFARTSTSTESESVRLLPSGAVYEAIAQTVDGNWIQILLGKSAKAWVFSGVIEIRPEQLQALPTVLVNETGESVAIPTATATPEPPTPAPTPAPETASAEVPGGTHIVRPGEYLSILAERYYGNQLLYPIIYEANKDLIGPDPGRVETGITLVIPPAPQ